MSNVITITRQFGSLGRPIAKMVAENLGYEYYDRDIIEMAAANLDESVYMLAEYDDHKVSAYNKMMFPLGFGATAKQNRLFELQKDIIVNLAGNKDCVIVGRCADYVLTEAKHKSLFSIFIYAPLDTRYNNCLRYFGFTQDSAEKYVQKIDESRSIYYRQYTGEKFDSLKYRHMLIDSSILPMNKTVELICSCAKIRFGLE